MAQEIEILVVEDNLGDLELTMHALRSNKLANQVQIARDGEEALDYLFGRGAFSGRNLEQAPKLILLDLKLPKVDGLDVLREIRNNPQTKPIPVVILTSSREEKDLVAGYQLGINSYIQKPVDFSEFRETVRQLGLYWLIINQPPPKEAFSSI
jgi:two-component system, response regulator